MINLPRFIFINGPAGSGKSTLAGLIEAATSGACWREAFAEPIREMIRVVFFPEEGPISYSFDLKDGEIKKRNMLELAKLNLSETFVGPTVRQTMIDFSEQFMKSCFGTDIFGRLLWKRCQEQELFYSHFIIDDSGFVPEATYVVNQSSAASCLLIRLHRSGCSFANDSRGYVSLEGVRTIDLDNDGAASEMIDTLQLELGNL